ncbi:hypothetical protein ACOME3_005668 [Neoechinorhynchus agilis]
MDYCGKCSSTNSRKTNETTSLNPIPVYFGNTRKWVKGINQHTTVSQLIEAILFDSKINMRYFDLYRLIRTSCGESRILTRFEQDVKSISEVFSEMPCSILELIRIPADPRVSARNLRKRIRSQNMILKQQAEKMQKFDLAIRESTKLLNLVASSQLYSTDDIILFLSLNEMINDATDRGERLNAESKSMEAAQNALDKLVDIRTKQLHEMKIMIEKKHCTAALMVSSDDSDTEQKRLSKFSMVVSKWFIKSWVLKLSLCFRSPKDAIKSVGKRL